MDLVLRLIGGEDENREIELDRDRITIGRDERNVMTIDFQFISARHAIISRSGSGDFELEDCDSRNGTWINSTKIGTGKQPIKPGDILRFGNVRYTLIDRDANSAGIAVIPLKDRRKPSKKLS